MRGLDPALYPWDGAYLGVHGHRLHYLDEGAGPPVLMVHGNPTWSFYYRELVKALSPSHRCIVPDHIGCGMSDKPDDDTYDYTLESRIDDLEALVEHLGIERLTLVVHDWGGAIGMGWAARNPDKVERLVLLNTAAFANPRDQRIPASLWLVRNTAIGSLLVRGLNAFSEGATRMAVRKRKLPRNVKQGYVAPYASWKDRIATLRFVQDIPLGPDDKAWRALHEASDGIAQFRETPALICWGERDFVFDGPFLAEWEKRLPDAEVRRFPDAGHYVLEDERDAIIEAIEAFFAKHPVEGE